MNEWLISENKINELLKKKGCVADLIFKETTGSTNSDLKELALSGSKSGTVVIALTQTNGRGRRGRSFYSPQNSGIYVSCLLDFDDEEIVSVTSAAAVAVYRAIKKVVGISAKIKWVNDIYYNNKKICGILAESVRNTKNELIGVVVGVGINCRNSSFPREIEDIAGSLSEIETNFSENELAAEIICQLFGIKKLIKDGYVEEYTENSLVIGKQIRIIGETEEEATALGIDEYGGLIVRCRDGRIKTLFTGEISIRLTEN